MPVNKNWSRWIFASTSKHFYDASVAADPDIKFYIEGQPITIKPDDTEAFEYRQDGPNYTQQTRHEWYIYIEINILIQAAKNDKDFHRMRRLAGIMEAAFAGMIPVYRYGDGPDDDQAQFGCLSLIQDVGKREKIQSSHFGQIDPNYNSEQATIEGHYEMCLQV